MRNGQVCGQSVTSCGSGISIRPASGLGGLVCASAKARPHLTMAAASAAVLQGNEQVAKLVGRILGSAERQHGNAKLSCPGKHALEPYLQSLRDAVADAFASYFQMDL